MSNLGAEKIKEKSNSIPLYSYKKIKSLRIKKGWIQGVLLTMVLAMLSGLIAVFPVFSVMGVMIISIILGMSWKGLMDIPAGSDIGITFSSKTLLRAGIILMGLRLNIEQIISAGFSIIFIDIVIITFTLLVIMCIGRFFSIDRHLSALIAVGTAVCGAAAIVAVAPLIGAKKELTAISVAFIAIMGTVVTIIYTFLYPVLGLDPYNFGLLTGATLHELAHVIAAAAPGGDISSDTALLVKLGRVGLLIPVAFILAALFNKKHPDAPTQKRKLKDLPIPWFIFGFLLMCLVNTVGILSETITQMLIALSIFLLSMAMAGLGLSVNFLEFKKLNSKVLLTGTIGSTALILLGFLFTKM
ncbi:YeiH family putative sulfate export transporter [Bacillus sp. EB106-08-02-XG196]|uniref:YeiH family protein n=1 Tax=Bacillus sp. EB106-08-02-XG196 TaxID=2737049 RepID=UPI0015C4B095|nr:YeiH family protein [Bacillus sp. EB106-08-02-XG196]NWQ42869.1 YeiH family putative sulfate export transporter [Bacillus sp. EB106-08-02-XG196]